MGSKPGAIQQAAPVAHDEIVSGTNVGRARPLQLPTLDLQVELADADGPFPAGLRLHFALPAGSYATVLLQELQGPFAPPPGTSAPAPQ